MTTIAPALDGTQPIWVHHRALPDRRKDRPRSARFTASDGVHMMLEAAARAEAPQPGTSVAMVERRIVNCLVGSVQGRHMAPVTEATVSRAYTDFQTLHNRTHVVVDTDTGEHLTRPLPHSEAAHLVAMTFDRRTHTIEVAR